MIKNKSLRFLLLSTTVKISMKINSYPFLCFYICFLLLLTWNSLWFLSSTLDEFLLFPKFIILFQESISGAFPLNFLLFRRLLPQFSAFSSPTFSIPACSLFINDFEYEDPRSLLSWRREHSAVGFTFVGSLTDKMPVTTASQ